MYARAFFEEMKFDSITVAPYMGVDSVSPFLEYDEKWTILLALTSNAGYADFQTLQTADGTKFYQHVLRKAASWGTPDNLMFVVGATHPEMLEEVRSTAPEHFFLVPGVGAQGGDLGSVAAAAMNDDVGLLVNSTRAVIYAGDASNFAEMAGRKTQEYQREMAQFLG